MILGYPQNVTGMQPPVAQQQPLFAAPAARDQLVQALINGPGPTPQQPSPTAGGGMPLGMLASLLGPQGGGAQQSAPFVSSSPGFTQSLLNAPASSQTFGAGTAGFSGGG